MNVRRIRKREPCRRACLALLLLGIALAFWMLGSQSSSGQMVAAGLLSWERMYDLSELVAGEAPGRASDEDITVFKNNVGLGLQFAAVASRVYEDARKAGIGRELPGEWFLQHMKP